MAKKRINPVRFVVMTTALLAACFGIAIAVRAASGHAYAVPLAIAGGIVFTLVPASILEWLVHRYVYHRKRFEPLAQIYRIHHRGHHAAIFPTWRYPAFLTARNDLSPRAKSEP